jgi:KipI family sensor histidine kinase inhibitor
VYSSPKYSPVGDRALLVKFGDTIDLDINRKVRALSKVIEEAKIHGTEECVPTYASLLVYYNPLKTSYEQMVFALKDLQTKIDKYSANMKTRTIIVPTLYGGSFGPDLADVAECHKLTEAEAIRLHSETEYVVYMIGFIAGFPYMGKVPEAIATPRLETPRLKIPAGSVGIAGNQTGIYPCESPGGWRIIGRTPLTLFNPLEPQPALLQSGDRARFKPIPEKEYQALGGKS